MRRYECAGCGTEIASRFVFDGLVFDANYFGQRMAEHRRRRREQRERVRQMLAEMGGRTYPGVQEATAFWKSHSNCAVIHPPVLNGPVRLERFTDGDRASKG